jgi:flagellar basal body-associated protein FliL
MANEPKKSAEKQSAAATDADAPKSPQSPAKSSNKTAFWGVLAGMIVVNIIVALIFVNITIPKPEKEKEKSGHESDSSAGAHEEMVEEPGICEAPIEAVVNLKGKDGMHYLKVVIFLSYDEGKFKGLGHMLAERIPEFKSIVVDRLSAKTFEDMERPTIRDEIRAELKRLINQQLAGGEKSKAEPVRIADVLINEFLIQ